MKRVDRIPLIDYLRGIAAVMVTWFHLTNGYGGNWVMQTGIDGWLGVEIFFVISGFVITLALARGDGTDRGARGFAAFMAKRIIRLEPPYLASIALQIALWYLSALVPGFNGAPPTVELPQLLFHIAYLIPFMSYGWIQVIYWSLTYEFFFYIFAGLALPVLASRHGTALLVAGSALAAALIGVGLAPPLSVLFLFGIAACRSYLRLDPIWASLGIVAAAATAMIVVGKTLEAEVGLVSVALMAANRHILAPPRIVAGVLAGLGAISYSLYLIHVPVGGRIVNLGSRSVHTPIEPLALSVLAFIVSCVAAIVFRRLIERPAIHAARRYSRGRREVGGGEA